MVIRQIVKVNVPNLLVGLILSNIKMLNKTVLILFFPYQYHCMYLFGVSRAEPLLVYTFSDVLVSSFQLKLRVTHNN